MKWKQYRKKTPVRARPLTQEDYEGCHGIIETHEGLKAFVAGDYLAQDALGVWPIARENILQHYCRVGQEESGPWKYYLSIDVREACQMCGAFTVGTLLGKAGDYLVRSGENSWPVDQEMFETTYEEISTNF